MTLEELRDRAIVTPSGCWLWSGAKTNLGYGTVCVDGRTQYVHRVAMRLAGRELTRSTDHLCRNRACFNPLHLDAVTQRVNVLRGEGVAAQHAKKTHCDNGHELSGANLIILNDRGWRDCRACRRARHAKQTKRGGWKVGRR